jgi:4-hydroxybenzoate decarboxylase
VTPNGSPPVRSLRDYLELLRADRQCISWPGTVRLEPDVRVIGAAAARDSGSGPAVLIEGIHGYPGARIAINVHGSFANLAILMGLPRTAGIRELFDELARRWHSAPGELERVAASEAPVHARRYEADINLYELFPLFRLNAFDGGFYIAKASTVSRDPEDPSDFGKQNVGVYRVQVQGRDRVSIMTAASHDLGRQIVAAEATGLPLRVAIMIGNHPAVTLFAGTPVAYEESEYEYAAGTFGQPFRLTTSGNGQDVLADSEAIIEAELLHGERVVEGPFGEFPGTYTGMVKAPVFSVTAVSTRTDPIFENICLNPGWGELDTLIGLNTCVPVYADLRRQFPEVVAVNALYQHGLTAIISVRNRFGGFAKSVAHRALGSPHGLYYLKNIILVDEDVDPFDLERVMWSLSTRTRPDDIVVLPNLPLVPLDPSAVVPGKGHRLIIDATRFVAPDPPGNAVPIDAPPPDALQTALDVLRGLQDAR